MEGTHGVGAAFPPCSSFLLGLQCREGTDDGAGAAWASFAVFLSWLRQVRVLVDFMIQMNSMKGFMDYENDKLGKFNDVNDV
jgi:hypothetical protein